MTTPLEISELYSQGENICALLRNEYGVDHNTREIIEISYDMQTGSYIDGMSCKTTATHKDKYAKQLAEIILSLCSPSSFMEAGVGEATTLSGVTRHLGRDIDSFGFDLSWSRVAYAKTWLASQGIKNSTLCTGDLLNIPFLDNSIDVVYTSHSIEPNGGKETPILKELYRVAKKYLILLEPGYELSSDQAKQRMDSHGYCKGLVETSNSLGFDILKHELFPLNANPLNPTAITIISKQSEQTTSSDVFACPKFKTPLTKSANAFYSPEGLVAYPILKGVPCLKIENGIFASKYEEFPKT